MVKMHGKYNRASRYYAVRAQRAALRSVLRCLMSWQPMEQPAAGYSVIVGCTRRLANMLPANLRMIDRQNLDGAAAIIIVFDTVRESMPDGYERRLRSQFSRLPLRFVYYSPQQVALTKAIGWAWVYSWLSWCKGIAATQTRFAILHDFDAMLLRRDILRERYLRIKCEPIEYLGVRYYERNGVLESDRLVTTFELMFDAAFVREHFKPIDLFNHVCTWRGRSVDFDTFLHAQARHGRSALAPLGATDMVHPSQMICQFTEFMNGRELNASCSSLLLIPYLLRLGREDDSSMAEITEQLQCNGQDGVRYFGRRLDVRRLDLTHAQWLAKLAGQLETVLYGAMRSDVRAYFDAICEHAREQHYNVATACR